MKIVLASNNQKKLKELQSILTQTLPVEVVAQGELGIEETEEPFQTFVENALTKARHASRHSGLPAIADDSGLSVRALNGAPGVLSARYATMFGRPKSDADNNQVLLEQMKSHSDRQARFVCALVAVRCADDPEPLISMGRWEGEILTNLRGEGGFGYDPLMFIPALNQTVAEIDPATKNKVSHRAQALSSLTTQIQQQWF